MSKIIQINMKIDKKDLKTIDDKARRYGLSRSSMLKIFALNFELSYETLGEFRRPVI